MSPNTEHVFVLTYSSGAGAAWGMTVGDPLMSYGPDSEWLREKSMADSYKVGPDGTEITFKLKQGVKFHDGTDFNAQAMKFSLDWALDPKNVVSTRPSIESIKSVEVVDDYTLLIRTTTLFAPLITNLGMTAAIPVSPTAFKQLGVDGMKSKGGASTGPFRVKEWVSGAQITFEKFPQYHQKGKPYLDSWVWVEVPDDRVRAAAMQAGQLDVIATGSGAVDSIKAMRDAKMLEFKLYEGPRLAHFNAARAPFNDLRVRQAAQMAIDRAAWNQALNGGEGYAYRGSLVPPGHAASYEVPEAQFPYPYDPARARALLEEYAREKGLKLPLDTMGAFTCTPEQKARGCYDLVEQPIKASTTAAREDAKDAEFAKSYLEAVGFKVVLEIGAGREAERTFVTKEVSFSFRGFGVRPHPSGTFDSYLGYGGYWNNGGWSTAPEQMELDRLVRAAGQTFDMAEQIRLYKEAQKLYMEKALGTDHFGRDQLSRLFHGARISFIVGVSAVLLAVVIGVPLGAAAAFWGGWVDHVIMRIVDAKIAIPNLLLAILLLLVLGGGVATVSLALGLGLSGTQARLVRSQALSVKEREYFTAAKAIGAPVWRLVFVHMLPNSIQPVIVQASLGVGFAVLGEAGLSFIGVGVMPPTPTWGSMLNTAFQYLNTAPWLSFAPGLAIFFLVLSFNFVGDGLRDVLDPRLRGRI